MEAKLLKINAGSKAGWRRIAFAVVGLSQRDFSKIEGLVAEANYDFRDVLDTWEKSMEH